MFRSCGKSQVTELLLKQQPHQDSLMSSKIKSAEFRGKSVQAAPERPSGFFYLTAREA